MMKLTINSDQSKSKAIGYIHELFETVKYFTVTIKTGKKRTMPQNNILHAWCEQVSLELREYTPMEIKSQVKFHIGCPMLRADEEYNEAYMMAIEALPSYENKLVALQFFPCTSFMDTEQLGRVLEAMQANYAKRGVMLRFQDDS